MIPAMEWRMEVSNDVFVASVYHSHVGHTLGGAIDHHCRIGDGTQAATRIPMTMADRRYESVVEQVGRMVRTEGVQGAAVAVAHRGRVVLEHYEGIAGPGLPAGQDVLWPLASISKLYTATMIVRLVEQGELTLSTRIQSILPRMESGGRERVTLRQLLTHTAGLIYESPEMARLMAEQTPLSEIVDEAYERPLAYEPGSDQLYSDLGFALAGRAAAVATRRDFADLVRGLVLEPAGLSNTFMPPPAAESARIAYVTGPFAEGTPGAMYNSDYARDLAHPAFGTVATLRDLLTFGLLFTPHAERAILSSAAIRSMVSDQTGGDLPGERVQPISGVIHPWGLGFMLKGRAGTPEFVSPNSFGHAGASGCILWIDPALDVVIAFVSNKHFNVDQDGFFQRLDRIVNVSTAALTRES
jgi:CubicO group peptidase (beta-lactamase class C family)